jgi:hypothetical protein
MPELVMLTLDRAAVDDLNQRAMAGDEAALAEFEHLWDDYRDRDLECFLDGNACGPAPFTIFLPDRDGPKKLIAVALCDACRELPRMVRLNRAIVMLKRMWSKKGGRQFHVTFAPSRRR